MSRVFVATFIFLVACGAEDDVPELEAEVSASAEALSADFTIMVIPAGAKSVLGPTYDDNICYLTRLTSYPGGPVWALLERWEGSGVGPMRWQLRGNEGLTATCVKLSWFSSGGWTEFRLSGDGQLPVEDEWPSVIRPPASTCVEDGGVLWGADAGSFISAMFAFGPGASSFVEISDSTVGPVLAIARGCSPAVDVGIGTGSLFVGSGGFATYIGSTYRLSRKSYGWTSTPMAKTKDAVCWFTKIGGGLNADGAVVEIFESGGSWRLAAKGGGDTTVEVEARCYARNQRG